MKNYRLKIFCDFDGTIAKNDVWISSLGKFIGEKDKLKELYDDYYSQRITIRESIDKELELIHNFTFDKFNVYLDEEEIDKHFKDFLEFCKVMSYDFYAVSGGFDYYINYIFEKKKIDAQIFACKMLFDASSGKLESEFTFSDDYCKSCGTCKRNILISNTNDLDNDISVYIGDGDSDFCVSNFADIVFAKGRLASYCWKNNITYFEYNNFSDVKNKLIKITERKNLKHRQEAKIKRRDIIMGG